MLLTEGSSKNPNTRPTLLASLFLLSPIIVHNLFFYYHCYTPICTLSSHASMTLLTLNCCLFFLVQISLNPPFKYIHCCLQVIVVLLPFLLVYFLIVLHPSLPSFFFLPHHSFCRLYPGSRLLTILIASFGTGGLGYIGVKCRCVGQP